MTAVQPGGGGSTCCSIICAGPAPNVKCCPILGIGKLNINRQELMNYKWFILLSQRLTNHAAQSAWSSCTHFIPFRSAICTSVVPETDYNLLSVLEGHQQRTVLSDYGLFLGWQAVSVERLGLLFRIKKQTDPALPLLFHVHEIWSVNSQQNY